MIFRTPTPQAPTKEKRPSKVLVAVFALAACGAIIAHFFAPPASERPPPASVASKFERTWRTDFHFGISKALAANHVSGCGELKYKQRADGSSEFVVYCTRDGHVWQSYLVWPSIQKVMGPYPPDPSLE
ncbi:MAG: hypothetical protein NVV63_02445 [Opitutus sp.]|nr:hypothetical protein [Opitutus sp.]